MRKYEKIKRDEKIDPMHSVVVQEKLDGANFRFTMQDDMEFLLYGSRNQEFNESSAPKNFKPIIEYIKKRLKNRPYENLRLLKDVIVYGEAMLKHTIQYDKCTPLFIIFDVYSLKNNCYLPYEIVQNWGEMLNMEVVSGERYPTFMEFYNIYMLKKEDIIPKSKYYDGPAEGVVIKDVMGQGFLKIVGEKYREAMKSPKKNRLTDVIGDCNSQIVATYCTEARLNKCLNKLFYDEVIRKVSMEAIRPLLDTIYNDIIEEEAVNIFKNNSCGNIQPKIIKKHIGSYCAKYIREKIGEELI